VIWDNKRGERIPLKTSTFKTVKGTTYGTVHNFPGMDADMSELALRWMIEDLTDLYVKVREGNRND